MSLLKSILLIRLTWLWPITRILQPFFETVACLLLPGIVTGVKFLMQFSVTQISGLLFHSKWLINLMGWDFFELVDAIFFELHFVTSSAFFCQQWSNFVSGFKMIVFWPSLSFTASFRTANDMPNRNFLGSSHFLFGFIFDGSICPISFVITSWARMFSFKVVLLFLSFFISSPRNLIFCFFEVIFISEACKKFWVWSNWLNNGINIMQNLTSSL